MKLQTNARTPQFQVVESPTVPEIALSRHFTRNILVGATLGLALACLIAVGRLAADRLTVPSGSLTNAEIGDA